jgi:hypothetical protein
MRRTARGSSVYLDRRRYPDRRWMTGRVVVSSVVVSRVVMTNPLCARTTAHGRAKARWLIFTSRVKRRAGVPYGGTCLAFPPRSGLILSGATYGFRWATSISGRITPAESVNAIVL